MGDYRKLEELIKAINTNEEYINRLCNDIDVRTAHIEQLIGECGDRCNMSEVVFILNRLNAVANSVVLLAEHLKVLSKIVMDDYKYNKD